MADSTGCIAASARTDRSGRVLRRRVLVTFVLGASLGAGIAAAQAATAVSGVYSFNVGGVPYHNEAVVEAPVGNGQALAEVAIGVNSGVVPTGTVGVRPILYNGSGSVCVAAPYYYYNPNPTSSYGRSIQGSCGKGIYFAGGTTEVWIGNSYEPQGVPNTPLVNN